MDKCIMRETVRVISIILHMANGDPSQGKKLIKCRNGVAEILHNYCTSYNVETKLYLTTERNFEWD